MTSIRLGLCCLSLSLQGLKIPIFCARTISRQQFQKLGEQEAIRRASQNVKDLYQLIEWNEKNGIKVLRISSDMFPRSLDEQCGYDIDFAKEDLKKAGDLAKKYNHRLTFHPGQFNVVGTSNEKSFQATVKELSQHTQIFKYMGFCSNPDSVIVLHGGGTYGNKEEAILKWVDNFGRLPKDVQEKLVLENCEKSYNVRDCLNISYKIESKYGFALPVVVDSHHYECYNLYHKDEKQESLETLVKEASQTWIKRGIRMKVHVSEQGEGQVGHHSDYIKKLPECFLNIPKDLNIGVDIMIEAKMKELAIFKLYDKYPQLDLRQTKGKVNENTNSEEQEEQKDNLQKIKKRITKTKESPKKTEKNQTQQTQKKTVKKKV